MISSVAALLKLMATQALCRTDRPRFWVSVLQTDGDAALLEADGKKITAKLEAAVKPGEKLFLEQLRTVDGKIHCKILYRLPAAESEIQTVDTFNLFWYQDQKRRTSYLLTAVKEEERAETFTGRQEWRFTLCTENFGVVTVLATDKQGRIECRLLVENEAAAANLAHLVKLFSPTELSGPVLQSIRVIRQGENSFAGGTGGCVDKMR